MTKKMLLAALLLALASQAVALSCADIKPLTHFNVTQYQGKWVGVAWQTFTNGVPTAPVPGTTCEHSILPHCVATKFKVVNSTRLDVTTEMAMSKDATVIKRKKMRVSESEQGRWHPASDAPGRHYTESLIIAGDPDKYIASLRCVFQPNSAEKVPNNLSIFSRRSRKEGSSEEQADVALSADELHEVKENVARIIGVAEFNPKLLKTDCVFA